MTTDLDSFLAHHGIKGMRWGHRKAENSSSNSSLSVSGTGDDTTKKKLTPEQVAHRKAVAKKIAIGIGIAAAAGLVAYTGYQGKGFLNEKNALTRRAASGFAGEISKNYGHDSGKTFRAGHEFFRYSDVQEKALRGRTYVASTLADHDAYSYLGGHKIKIGAKGDIVTPSTKERVDILMESINKRELRDMARGKKGLGAKLATITADKKKLAAIKLDSIALNDYSTPAAKKFIEDMLERGFSGVADDYDKGSATILFDAARMVYDS